MNQTAGTCYQSLVLLLDDQVMVGEVVRRFFEGEPDIDFHFSAEPGAAIEIASRLQPTVILLDLVMPQIDGLSLVRQLRDEPITALTPIIVLSTKEDAQIKSEAFTAGANDYLVKLPARAELLARVRYHSRAHLNQIQRNEAYRALRESQQLLIAANNELRADHNSAGA